MNKLMVTIDGHAFEVEVEEHMPGVSLRARIGEEWVTVLLPQNSWQSRNVDWVVVGERPYEIVYDEQLHWIKAYSGIHRVEVRDLAAIVSRPRSGDGRLKAPIPGLITQILVAVGDEVEIGQPVLVLEAMKMENEIRATRAGQVTAVHVSLNQSVIRGEVMAEIA